MAVLFPELVAVFALAFGGAPVGCASVIPGPDGRPALGVHRDADDRIELDAAQVCGPLELLRRGYAPRVPGRREAIACAAHTLAHELGHRAGIIEEWRADQYAIRHLVTVAEAVGADPAYARVLLRVAREEC